jgi:DNA-binding NtrC family response regulator
MSGRPAPSDAEDQGATPPKRGRILVVDDETLMLDVLRRILGREHDVVTASDGRAALERIVQDEPFDFVLCDLTMSGMSGVEFFAHVKATHPELVSRFAFLTGGAVTPEAARVLAEAPCGVIEKPFDPQAVRELIRRRM